jgi:hypothetical protein
MPPRSLSDAWKKKSWMGRLSGLTLEPSTAARGAVRWIASLEATPVSLFPSRAGDEARPIQGICGRVSDVLSKKCSPDDVSSRMSPTIYEWAFSKPTMTFETWVTELRRACLQRRKSVRLTSGGDYSSSPTQWSTPRASDGEKGGPNMSFGTGGTPLPAQAVRFHPSLPDLRSLAYGRELQGRTLNPLFCEWLMGWPIGWTAFEFAVTESCPWRQRMRGEFSKLVLRYEATIKQP